MATSSDMARHLAPLISASSTTLFTPVNHPSSPVLASAIPLEQHYSFDENLQTRSSFHPQISSSSPAAPDLSWLPMMPDTTTTTTQTPLSPAASVSESLIDPLCSVLQAPASPPTVESPPATPAADDHVLDALYFPESGTFIGYRGFPTFRQTTQLVNAYISTLSSVKKNKSLISRQMYADIKTILRDVGNTQVGSAQFRFWARRNFDLFRDTDGHVCVMHKGKPVAVREDLYDVLAVCHLVCRHGGRDKTLGQLREWHSRVPKNLISQFIKLCPTCNPTSVTADSHPEYVIDAYPQQHQQQQPSALLLSAGGSTLDSQTKAQVAVSFTLRRSIVCCKMSPGIDAVVKAAEAAAATAGNGRDESCYVGSEDDVRSGVAAAAAAAAPAAAAVVPMARKASLPKSVKPVAFMAKARDHLPVVKLEDEETAEYSFPLPRPEHGTFLASGGTESTVSLHSDAGHGADTEITLAMAEKALANISAYTHPSSPGPLDDVYYDQNSTAAARSPAPPRQHHYRASLAELEPNLVPRQTELPSSPLRPESDDDEYVAGKTPPSSSSPSPPPPRRTCKRRAPAPTTTGTTAPAAFLLSSSSSSSCASPVRKSARLHKTLLF